MDQSNKFGYQEEKDQYTPESQEFSGKIDPLIHYAIEKSIEEKIYIVLYVLNSDYTEEDLDRIYHNIYSVCIGRSETYEDIKLKLNSSIGVDVYRSIVITETLQTETRTSNTKYYLMPFNECISVYEFVKRVQPLMPKDDFDIDFFIEEGMEEIVRNVNDKCDAVFVDAVKLDNVSKPVLSLIKGDALSLSIAAASIIAKVTRDDIMLELDKKYPMYDFKNNKGYGTKTHLLALEKYGVTKHHRMSYAPVFQASQPKLDI